MDQEVDSLSACVSLVDILSLLPLKDLTTCRLVSRRLRDFIFNHNTKMAKQRMYMALRVPLKEPGKATCADMTICLRFRGKELRFDIDDDSVHMSGHHDRDIIKYFRRRGHRMRRKRSSIEKFAHIEDGDIYFSVENLEDGLTLVLSRLFTLYHFRKIKIKARYMAPQLRAIIANEFRKAQSFCVVVQCNLWPGKSFFDHFRSQIVRIVSWKESSHALPAIPFWELSLLKMRLSLHSQQPIVDLLLEWERVDSCRPFEFHLHGEGFWVSGQEFFGMLKKSLTLSQVVYEDKDFVDEKNQLLTATITRLSNNVQIFIEYIYGFGIIDYYYKVKIYRPYELEYLQSM